MNTEDVKLKKELMKYINSKTVFFIAIGKQCLKADGQHGIPMERIAAWTDIIGWFVVPLALYLDVAMIATGVGATAKAALSLLMLGKFVIVSILLLVYRAPWYIVPLVLLVEVIAWLIPGSLIFLLNPYSNITHYLRCKCST